MSATTLREIEASINGHDLQDQVRLLEFLTPKIAGGVRSSASANAMPSDQGEALRRLHAGGERLKATSVDGAPSLVDAVSEMRR